MHAHCCANGTLKKKPCLLEPEFPGPCKSLCWVLRLQRMPWYPGVPCQDCPDFYMVNKIVVQNTDSDGRPGGATENSE